MWGKKRHLFIALVVITLLGSLPLGMPGMPFSASERLFLFVCNVLNCVVSWRSFQCIFQDSDAGVLCAMLYTLSIYRLYLAYGKSGMQETASMLFLPPAVCAIHGVYTEKTRKKRLLFWGMGILAVTAVLHIHMLSGVLAGMTLCIVFLLLWRKSFNREMLPEILISVVVTILCNARLIGRGIQEIKTGVGLFQDMRGRMIQSRGLYPAQLFFSFFEKGIHHNYVEKGLREAEAIGVGMALVLPLGIFLFLWLVTAWNGKGSPSVRTGKIAAIVGSGAMLLSLSAFPWTEIQLIHRYVGAVVASCKSPEHFLLIATIALTVVAGAALMWVKEMGSREAGIAYAFLTVLPAAGTAIYYLGNLMYACTAVG